MKSFMTVLFLHGALLDWFMSFSVSKFLTISGHIGMQINTNLNVCIDIVCVVTDIADRQNTLIDCIEYVITQEIIICSFTAKIIKYCISRALHGVAVSVVIKPD
jgi:hypothetical protein